jgi:hypothetical protein
MHFAVPPFSILHLNNFLCYINHHRNIRGKMQNNELMIKISHIFNMSKSKIVYNSHKYQNISLLDWLLTFRCFVKYFVQFIATGKKCQVVGFQALTTDVMKSSVFEDVTTCSLLQLNWRFEGKYCIQPQGWREKQETNQYEAGSKEGVIVALNFTALCGVMSLKEELFNNK